MPEITKAMKCQLCASDEAEQDGLLCLSCREAIERLQTISDAERARDDQEERPAASKEPSQEGVASRSGKPDKTW